MERHKMSIKELERATLLSEILKGSLNLKDVSIKLGLSYRQTRRIYAKYKQFGATGLKHGLVGRLSSPPTFVRKRVSNNYSSSG